MPTVISAISRELWAFDNKNMKIGISGKGGSGKTTISATLARVFARQGLPVLAIDGGLKQVEQNTAPLNAGVEKLNGSLSDLAGGLMVAESSFASADMHLQETLNAITVNR